MLYHGVLLIVVEWWWCSTGSLSAGGRLGVLALLAGAGRCCPRFLAGGEFRILRGILRTGPLEQGLLGLGGRVETIDEAELLRRLQA